VGIKALLIVADGAPGGGTTHVLQILGGLSYACSFGLVTQKDSYLFREARHMGIPCADIDFFRGRLDLRVSLRLRRLVRRFGPQLVHVHGGRAAFFHSLAATKVPTVYTVHGYHFLLKGSLRRWLATNAERLNALCARCVILVSNHDAEVARSYRLLLKPEKSLVVHNGIPLASIPEAWRRGLEHQGLRHVGFVGRLEDEKDPLLFLDVVERLPGYAGTVIGGGALQPVVKSEIRRRGLHRVRMLGALPHPQALEKLASFGTLIITSRSEAFGMIAAEAMWSGVPVVAVDVGGLGEVIENGKSGLLVDVRSPDDLARAVIRLDEDAALRTRVVEEGRRRVRDLF
jgi:glycosyltransferase involved in cell wall biosynthesis